MVSTPLSLQTPGTFPLLIYVKIPLEKRENQAVRAGKGHLAPAMSDTLSNSVLPAPRATGAGGVGGGSALHWLDYTFLILAPSRAGQFSRWMLFNLKQFELYWTVLHRENLAKKQNKKKTQQK